MNDERRGIANRHWVDAFRDLVDDLGGEFREYGSVSAFLGNLPMPFANGCLVVEPTDSPDLEAAITWVAEAGVPYQVRFDEQVLPPLEPLVTDLGLVRDPESMPAMVLTPIPTIPASAPGVLAQRVDHGSYNDFMDILIDSGIPARFGSQIFAERLIDSPNAAYFVASLEDEPAGISVAVRTGKSGGIYSVATLEKARRRGVGTAATWAAIAAIRDWGCTAAVLQASAMGYPVYRAMGFEQVTRYIRFAPPSS